MGRSRRWYDGRCFLQGKEKAKNPLVAKASEGIFPRRRRLSTTQKIVEVTKSRGAWNSDLIFGEGPHSDVTARAITPLPDYVGIVESVATISAQKEDLPAGATHGTPDFTSEEPAGPFGDFPISAAVGTGPFDMGDISEQVDDIPSDGSEFRDLFGGMDLGAEDECDWENCNIE